MVSREIEINVTGVKEQYSDDVHVFIQAVNRSVKYLNYVNVTVEVYSEGRSSGQTSIELAIYDYERQGLSPGAIGYASGDVFDIADFDSMNAYVNCTKADGNGYHFLPGAVELVRSSLISDGCNLQWNCILKNHTRSNMPFVRASLAFFRSDSLLYMVEALQSGLAPSGQAAINRVFAMPESYDSVACMVNYPIWDVGALTLLTGVDETAALPQDLMLHVNCPNPFNPRYFCKLHA